MVDMATQITAAKMLVLKAATEKTKDISQSGAMAKLSSQTAMDTTIEAVKFTVEWVCGRISC
jgi:alkylation response protein AidB-like acyl-CoA dehydrogenase